MPEHSNKDWFHGFDLLSYDMAEKGAERTVITKMPPLEFSEEEKLVHELEARAQSHEHLQTKAHDLFKKRRAVLASEKQMREDMEFLKTVELNKTHPASAPLVPLKIDWSAPDPRTPIQKMIDHYADIPLDLVGMGDKMAEAFAKEFLALPHNGPAEKPGLGKIQKLMKAMEDGGYNAHPSEVDDLIGLDLKRKAEPEAPSRPVVRQTTSRPSQDTVDPSEGPRRIVEL